MLNWQITASRILHRGCGLGTMKTTACHQRGASGQGYPAQITQQLSEGSLQSLRLPQTLGMKLGSMATQCAHIWYNPGPQACWTTTATLNMLTSEQETPLYKECQLLDSILPSKSPYSITTISWKIRYCVYYWEAILLLGGSTLPILRNFIVHYQEVPSLEGPLLGGSTLHYIIGLRCSYHSTVRSIIGRLNSL